jgi:hypothetical protein
MAASYKPGQKYFQHRTTGAVFQYRDRIAGNTDLMEMVANDEGVLEKVQPRVAAETTRKLNPTKTPEKKDTAPAQTKTAAPTKPTLTPASK